MPTLHWIGKEAVTNHHKDVPYRMLEPDEKLSHGQDGGNGNLIVQGDNLHALKALLPKYAGKVKCIYIDPPYNTGNEGWVYNDNVKAPEIQKWLGQVVGKEAEDLSRHDKWLCMMYPRLVLLREFLSEDGVVFISIDDNEVASLIFLCNEIFGAGCFICDAIWRSADSSNNDAKQFSLDHNHTIIYSRNAEWLSNELPRTAKDNSHYKNPDQDPNGPWFAGNVSSPNPRENLRYNLLTPQGEKINPPGNGWRWSKKRMNEMISTGEVSFTGKGTGILRKTYLKNQKGLAPSSLWANLDETGHNRNAKYEIKKIFPNIATSELFSTPKPTLLLQRILQIATDKDSIILDSFAGSGTTAHAVLKQNAEDGGNRKFILCEMEENIAENITRKRVLRVADGYTDSKGKAVAGLGGSFQYCRLSEEPLFNADGRVRPDVNFDQLAEFVWYNETGKGWHGWEEGKKKTKKKAKPSELGPIFDTSGQIRSYPRGPLLGVENGHAFVLLYNGILSDRSDLGGNVLTQRTLDYLRETIDHDGHMTVFAARNRFANKRLREQGITYKQLPYRIDA